MFKHTAGFTNSRLFNTLFANKGRLQQNLLPSYLPLQSIYLSVQLVVRAVRRAGYRHYRWSCAHHPLSPQSVGLVHCLLQLHLGLRQLRL